MLFLYFRVKKKGNSMESLFDRIKRLSKSRDISLQDLATELSFSKNLIYRWKTSDPKAKDLEKVADYFNVSVDYLLGRDDQNTNTDNEIDLSGIAQPETEEKIFSYEGKEIPKKDLELIRRILETGEYDE